MKKVGGVRGTPHPGAGKSPPAPPTRKVVGDIKRPVALLPKSTKTVGAVKRIAGTSIYHPQGCCDGTRMDGGMWIHTSGCPQIAVTWKVHGATKESWTCPHGCQPADLGESYTHRYSCPWWGEHLAEVPFGRAKPRGEDSRSSQAVLDIRQQAAINWAELDSEDDDLPF